MLKVRKSKKLLFEHYFLNHCTMVAILACIKNYNKLFLPCLEVCITTFCTLCCENCSNLMQYYTKPYHVSIKKINNDISIVCNSVDGIDCLRILGGEPLLAPDLAELLEYVSGIEKIKNVVIITNGTMIFSNECLNILSKNRKFKISVSDYRNNSPKLTILSAQLAKENINYSIDKIIWRDKSNIACRNKSYKELKWTYQNCPNYFFSLLNGNLHICPRSSHGADLGIFSPDKDDFICVRDYSGKNGELRKRITKLLNRPFIVACDYCSEEQADRLPVVETAKQCTRDEAHKKFMDMIGRGLHVK